MNCPRCGNRAFLLDARIGSSGGGVRMTIIMKKYGCPRCDWFQEWEK